MRKIGVYGGSFDPVHKGHEWIVQRALNEGLDSLILMPCFISPHKLDHSPESSAENRLGMLRSVFSECKSVEISDWEIQKESVSYTWQTLDYLKSREPDSKIVLILGGDQFRVIDTWSRSIDWVHQVEFLVFPRRGERNEFDKQVKQGLQFRLISDYPPEISSSMIRESIQNNALWEQWVSPVVKEWIIQNHLFGYQG